MSEPDRMLSGFDLYPKHGEFRRNADMECYVSFQNIKKKKFSLEASSCHMLRKFRNVTLWNIIQEDFFNYV